MKYLAVNLCRCRNDAGDMAVRLTYVAESYARYTAQELMQQQGN